MGLQPNGAAGAPQQDGTPRSTTKPLAKRRRRKSRSKIPPGHCSIFVAVPGYRKRTNEELMSSALSLSLWTEEIYEHVIKQFPNLSGKMKSN